MDRILLSTREIIRTSFPVTPAGYEAHGIPAGLPCIFNQPVYGWLHGDRAVIAQNQLPAVVFDSEDLNKEFNAFHAYKRDWSFSIMSYVQLDENDETVTFRNRLTSMIERILQKNTKMWIFEPCFICGQDFINGTHLITHSAELDTLAANAKYEAEQRWNITHKTQGFDTIPTAPIMNDKDAYIEAYYRLYESGTISSPAQVTPTMTNQEILNEYKANYVLPVRFLSYVVASNISYGVTNKTNNQYLLGSQIKVSATEIDPVHTFGPI